MAGLFVLSFDDICCQGKKYKTARWTNTAVKLNYAHWAFFIGIMLAGAEAKPCVSHVTNPFIEQQALSFPSSKKSTRGKWPISMHRHEVNFSLFFFKMAWGTCLICPFQCSFFFLVVCASDPKEFADTLLASLRELRTMKAHTHTGTLEKHTHIQYK